MITMRCLSREWVIPFIGSHIFALRKTSLFHFAGTFSGNAYEWSLAAQCTIVRTGYWVRARRREIASTILNRSLA